MEDKLIELLKQILQQNIDHKKCLEQFIMNIKSNSAMTTETFQIYLEYLNKDLNNLGQMIRDNKRLIELMQEKNNEQDIHISKLVQKIALIAGAITFVITTAVSIIIKVLF